jgi:hypothetical protein
VLVESKFLGGRDKRSGTGIEHDRPQHAFRVICHRLFVCVNGLMSPRVAKLDQQRRAAHDGF